jgi:hypothetical protein
MYQFLNQPTSKISKSSLYSQISLLVFLILGFEGGIRVFKRGGPNFNHQTSKISKNLVLVTNLFVGV